MVNDESFYNIIKDTDKEKNKQENIQENLIGEFQKFLND